MPLSSLFLRGGLFSSQDGHDLVGVTSLAKQIGHDLHGMIDVIKEKLEART